MEQVYIKKANDGHYLVEKLAGCNEIVCDSFEDAIIHVRKLLGIPETERSSFDGSDHLSQRDCLSYSRLCDIINHLIRRVNKLYSKQKGQ